MTEERQSPKGISLLQSMLNRLKCSENLQDPSYVTAQHRKYVNNTNQCDNVLNNELDKPERNVAESNNSECSVKPDLEYYTQRTVHESNPISTIFPQSDTPSSLLHNVISNTWHDLQPSESHLLLEEVKVKQTSNAESDISIPKNRPTHEPSGSSDSNSEPGLAKETTVKKEYYIMKQPCRTENTVTSVEEALPPPLPPKQRNFNQMHVQLQRNFTLKDFKLDLEPINLLEEVCTGVEWAKFLPVIGPSPQPDAKDDSQREDSHNSSDYIESYNAVTKPNLSADKEQSEISSSLVSVTDNVIQTRQETSPKESPISELPKTPLKKVTVAQMQDIPENEQFKDEENDLMVIYLPDKTELKKVKDPPLDLSVVKSSGILDNSALKSRIQLNSKRKHRPPGKRKRGNIKLLFYRQHSTPTEFSQLSTSSPVSVSFSSSKFYSLPESNDCQTKEDCHTSVPDEMPLVTNTTSLQMISEVPEFCSNDNGIAKTPVCCKNDQLSIEENIMDVHHDFSFVKSSGLLDNSALKVRINLSKKRKHRPPGKRKNENTKEKFPIKYIRQRSASESHQSRPSSHASVVSSSAFYNIPCSKSMDSHTHQDFQTAVLVNEKAQEKNAAALPTILEVLESSSNNNDIAEMPVLQKNNQQFNMAKLMDVPYDFSLVKSSGLLDNSALKDRISLSKKRKDRPPGKRYNENTKKMFPIKLFRQRSASESRHSHPSSHISVFSSSAFYNIPRSYNSNDSKSTSVPANEKQKTKDQFLKPKLRKMKS